MVRIGSLVLVVCLAPLLLAQKYNEKKAEAKPNRLTAKEVADGWLLLFDGETAFGWKVEGEAKVEKGKLVIGGRKATTLVSTTAWGECEVSWQSITESSTVTFAMHGSKHPVPTGQRPVTYHRATKQANLSWVERTNQGDTVRVRIEPRPAVTAASPLVFTVPAGQTITLSDIQIKPHTPTRLFNGKDLTGWKVFKGNAKQEKSKFTVTKEGWLNVKDGPGDLQTTKHFGDFVLQLECISNGTRLNSGVFFRCQPDKYQQGYEAQVHNGWLETPKTITVDDYDPKAKKAFKRKVTTTAMDFGTGAIYRRQPARRAVAKDKEWFTMTVVAHGRHFATWVNGIQQVDWTDHRPESDNARQGYRAKAGAISIQGHDPTTDLSFRNIRVGTLP